MLDFEKRINLNVPLEKLSQIVCENYKLGKFLDNQLIVIGYEDFNYILTTEKGKFVVKVFSNLRSDQDALELTMRGVTAYKNGISTPKIYDVDGNFLFKTKIEENNYRLLVMDYIDGTDFYSTGTLPSDEELSIIAKELARLNKLEYQPPFIYDHWAIVNFENEYKKYIDIVESEDKKLIENVYKDFLNCDLSKLDYGFVHGDIIVTNVIKENKSGKLYFIDFSVSNYLPRIVDLAVSICDLCLELSNIDLAKRKINLFVNSYESISPLSNYEKECLNVFLRVHQAITILETTKEKLLNNNDSEENDDFLRKSRLGLRILLNELN